MSGSECIQKISRSTLIPIGLAIVLVIAAFWFGVDRATAASERRSNGVAIAKQAEVIQKQGEKLEYLTQAMLRLEVKFETLPADDGGGP